MCAPDRGSVACGICRRRSPGYDTGPGRRRWRSLDLGTIQAFVEADAPRVQCRVHGVVVGAVPWARHDAGLTHVFDDQVAWLATRASKSTVVDLMRIAWRTVGSIISRVWADADDRFDGLRRIGIDEISYKKGHKYLMVVVDHDTRRLVWAAPGRDRATVAEFFDLLGEDRCALKHRDRILAAIKHNLSNGLIDSTNTKIRLITRAAFGFHSAGPLIALAMLTLGPHSQPSPAGNDPGMSGAPDLTSKRRSAPLESGADQAFMAVTVGFEPTVGGYPTQLFESCTFGRSDTSPRKSVRDLARLRESACAHHAFDGHDASITRHPHPPPHLGSVRQPWPARRSRASTRRSP
ncbi:hypothetical protein GCM10022382_10370 [Microbacterium invictum]